MAEVQANLPVDFFEVGPDDEQHLTKSELATLSLFEGLKKALSVEKFPGSMVLRKCVPGQVMCRQGEAGASAFFILSSKDIVELRQLQLKLVDQAAQQKQPEVSPEPHSESEIPVRLLSMSRPELTRLRREFEAEIAKFSQRAKAIEQAKDDAERERLATVAKVKLLVSLNPDQPRRGLLHRLKSWFRKPVQGDDSLAFIPVDGLMSLDTRTLEAPLHEKEVFGEMSCLNRAPRSATVIVEQDCYMLEFLRNLLDMLYKDAKYKERMDAIYRQRVLDKQVRQLSVFKELSDAEFQQLQPRLELVEFEAGKIIFDEHDDSDCLYLIRSGLVKVVKQASALISRHERKRISSSTLASELVAGATSPQSVAGRVWSKLSPELQSLLTRVAGANAADVSDADKEQIAAGLNAFIRSDSLRLAFGEKVPQVISSLDDLAIETVVASFPEKVKEWSEARSRLFHRALLEAACPRGLPRRELRPPRTLKYLSKGEILGELGLIRSEPRSATCLAFDQRDRGHAQSKLDLEANPSRVELVRLNRADLDAVSPSLRRILQQRVEKFKPKEDQPIQTTDYRSLQSQSPEFEALGLIQGQRLMLIDLEKCTRCGACVEACVDAHDDGRNRLYLDGPRFDKYLVPVTCRSCLDPVCMIGCPVGAISRGDNDEIRIRNHCIGCNLCADQCPYGSIHMSERELSDESSQQLFQLEAGITLKKVTEKAVVCDLCSTLPGRDPACVYACPHDATFRVDARQFFGDGG